MSKWPSRAEQLSLLVGQILSPGANLVSQLTSAGGALASQIEQRGKDEDEGQSERKQRRIAGSAAAATDGQQAPEEAKCRRLTAAGGRGIHPGGCSRRLISEHPAAVSRRLGIPAAIAVAEAATLNAG